MVDKKAEKFTSDTTSTGLPIVTRATIEGTVQSDKTGERVWGDRLEEVKKRMLVEQPDLVNFLESQVGRYPEELQGHLFELTVGFYSLLEQQAKINNLKSKISL